MDNSDSSEPHANLETPPESPLEAPLSPPTEATSRESSVVTPASTPIETPATSLFTTAESVNQSPNPNLQPASPVQNQKKFHKKPLVVLIIVLLAVLGAGTGGYILGSHKKQASTSTAQVSQSSADKELAVPQGATVIAQCSKGRGTQYALPKDIPLGPVYNVYQGKVIGIEFMVGKDDLLGTAKNFLNLPLYSVKYDHVNIGLLSQGHAGFPAPHYHVDIMTVPASVTDKITCT